MQVCPACGQENPERSRFCGMCGAALAPVAARPREERKVVTILFTDLVGPTARAEGLDPEDVRATLSAYYAQLRAELERHGGTVEKFIGDAVMAIFGAPVSHEDDPERAVRAALAIRDSIGEELQIRTAVNTGVALVALGARAVEGEGMVSGDVVNTAARLQSAAPVNGILVGEGTYRATRHAIEYQDAPSVEAKGKSEPVKVWEAVAARSRFGSDVEQKLRTPLVGRERERGLLADSFQRARTEQSAQLVTLVGVPGIGKSRLVAALFQIPAADEEIISWRQGRSLPYGERVSFWALGEIVKAHAGILESDDTATAEEKLAAMVEALSEDEREREWLARHTRPLVGLEGAERTEREEAFAAWRRLLEAAAEQRPLVLVFEDLHWADDGLLDFVDHLADWATTVPLLIVGTARPELLDRRPGWGGGKRNALTLSIGALTDDETAQLLQRLLDRAVLDADAQQAVLQCAEGNPLYAEEYAQMLAHHYREALTLAEAAGIDASALREPARQAFAEGARRALSLGAGEAARDLAHEALALTEADDPERPELALILGYAGRLVGVNEELVALLGWAVDAFVAQDHLARAAEASAVLGGHLFYLGDVTGTRAARDRGLELARLAPPSPSTVRAYASASRSFFVLDRDLGRALESAREALRLAEEIGDGEAAAISLNTIGMTRVYQGDPAGIGELEQSIERASQAGSVFNLHSALNNLANQLWHVGRLAEGSARIREARALCEQYGFSTALQWNDAELGYEAHFRGDLDEVLAAADVVLAREPSEVGYQFRPMLATRAFTLLARGRLKEAAADAERALSGLREGGADAQVAPFVLTAAACSLRAAGRDLEADVLLAEVLAAAVVDELIYDLPLHLVELERADDYLALTEGKPGHLWQEAGRAAASGDLGGAAEIYGRIGARFAEAWAGLLAAERGDASRLDAALAYFEEQQATPYVQRCRALMQASA